MAKGLMQQYYYQPIQNMSGVKPSGKGKKWLAIGGFLLMVGVAYYIYQKSKKGNKIKGSIKSIESNLPIWSNLRDFDLASRISIKGSKNGTYIQSPSAGSYLGEATGNIEKGSDGMFYREIVPPTDRKDMFKSSSGAIVYKAYVLAKATQSLT